MSTTGNLRVLQSDDLYLAQELDQQYFNRPWSPLEWTHLDLDRHKVFIWEHQTKVIGFCLFGTLSHDEAAHLYKILIVPESRGTTHAVQFFEQVRKRIGELGFSKIYLEVESQNKRAIGFYKKLGFSLLREIKGFYSDGSSAQTMELTL